MHFALTAPLSRLRIGAAAAMLASGLAIVPAAAESAYVEQPRIGARMPTQGVPVATSVVPGAGAFSRPAPNAPRPNPEAVIGAGRNFAQTIQIGNYNQVAQIQNGANNHF